MPPLSSFTRLASLSVALLLAACAGTPAPRPAVPSGPTAMVAAADPRAVEAGVNVLRQGGSAVDAAIAVQGVLGLVEPQSSSLGGGAFMVYYDGKTRQVTAYDGRETAPAGATPDMFQDDTGKPLPTTTAILSGRSTGAPGAIAMLALAHTQHGVLPWSSLFGDAERLADEGFTVSPRLSSLVNSDVLQASAPDALAYFTKPDGTKVHAGDVLRNAPYAATLRRLAAEGPAAILQGSIAEAIVTRVRQGALPGTLSLADLAAYRPKAGPALCRPYRIYVVCSADAPSGGPALLEGLGILERTDIPSHGPDDAQGWYLVSQASRLIYADRDRYLADPAFVAVPVEGLLEPGYLDARAALIGPLAGPAPKPGLPRGAPAVGPDATHEPGGTSHFVIVDKAGDVLSMTTTVESIFGSGRMVDGFFLNNQLTDFSFSPREADGTPAANAVAPGKRPRSSMSPTVVLDRQGRFVAALGSPGGAGILAYNLKALVGVLDWKLSIQQAIELPNLIAKGDAYVGETAKFAPGVLADLAQRGVTVKMGFGAEGSGFQGVTATPAGLVGGADPRREGAATGF